MHSIVVLDCDLISTFAKVNRIDILEKLFADDSKAVEFCKEKGVKVLNLKDVLRKIAADRVINDGAMIKLIRDIEDKDRTFIIGANDVLGEYE